MKNYEVIENRIYTDGSCKKITSYDGTGFIAWGFIVVRDEKGNRLETTVGRIIFNQEVRKALA